MFIMQLCHDDNHRLLFCQRIIIPRVIRSPCLNNCRCVFIVLNYVLRSCSQNCIHIHTCYYDLKMTSLQGIGSVTPEIPPQSNKKAWQFIIYMRIVGPYIPGIGSVTPAMPSQPIKKALQFVIYTDIAV